MNPKVNAYFDALKDKRIVVLGLGVSNRPLVRMLLERGLNVTGCDRIEREKLDEEVLELERDGCTLRLGEGYLDGLEADIVFRTPGMHPDRPELLALREQGAQLTSEMEVFFAVCPCRIIAVTGSDGKTTTTTLIAELLKHAGHTVWLGGNIGTPLLPQAEEMSENDYAVVELSSFQLMYFGYSAHIAVVTNLAPNHLDVHKDMAEYVRAKQNIYLRQSPEDTLIVNMDNEIAHSFAVDAPGKLMKFSRRGVPEAGVYLHNGIIYRADGSRIMTQADILLPGIHNVENYMAAIAAVDGLVTDEQIVEVARSFGGVEHRIELVRVKDGVRYYNDSIASSPSRTIAGLRSFNQKLILIAGGYDKHIPYDVLGPEICKHVKILITNGTTGPKIRQVTLDAAEQAGSCPLLVECENLAQAVEAAAGLAQEGDVVILSPASAAFDQFKNFMVRGAAFKQQVRAL